MSGAAAAVALLAAATLAGCGMLDPYPTAPSAAQPGAAPAPRVAICYNRLKTPPAEVRIQAQHECAAGTKAEPADTDYYLTNCPLLLPARATFVCIAKK